MSALSTYEFLIRTPYICLLKNCVQNGTFYSQKINLPALSVSPPVDRMSSHFPAFSNHLISTLDLHTCCSFSHRATPATHQSHLVYIPTHKLLFSSRSSLLLQLTFNPLFLPVRDYCCFCFFFCLAPFWLCSCLLPTSTFPFPSYLLWF